MFVRVVNVVSEAHLFACQMLYSHIFLPQAYILSQSSRTLCISQNTSSAPQPLLLVWALAAREIGKFANFSTKRTWWHSTSFPCPVLSCLPLPCPTPPHPDPPCRALPRPALYCPALPCPALLCPTLPRTALPCSSTTWRGVQEVALQAFLTWAKSAPPEQADTVQQVLQHCLGLASSPCRQVRMALARQAPALAQPHLLKALYGADDTLDGSGVASLEAKLLQACPPTLLPPPPLPIDGQSLCVILSLCCPSSLTVWCGVCCLSSLCCCMCCLCK